MTGEAREITERHLRAVPDRPDPIGQSPVRPAVARPRGFGRQMPSRQELADAFGREARLLKTVRAPAAINAASRARPVSQDLQSRTREPSAPIAGTAVQDAPAPAGLAVPAPPVDPVAVVGQGGAPPRSPSELGRRFEELAGRPGNESGESSEAALDSVLARLRAGSSRGSANLPAAAFRDLVRLDADAAGAIMVGLLPSLHRVVPDLRIDVDLKDRILAVDSSGGRTVIEERSSRRRRRERDAVVAGRPADLCRAAFGHRGRRVRGRRGLAVIGRLVSSPHRLDDLLADGADFAPAAIWKLVATSVPAAPADFTATVVHSGPGPKDGPVTVTFRPGHPISAVDGTCSGADARVTTTGHLAWLAGVGEASPVEGDREAAERLREAFALAFSPIRKRA